MALTFNGVTPDNIVFNGTNLDVVQMNGTIVWESKFNKEFFAYDSNSGNKYGSNDGVNFQQINNFNFIPDYYKDGYWITRTQCSDGKNVYSVSGYYPSGENRGSTYISYNPSYRLVGGKFFQYPVFFNYNYTFNTTIRVSDSGTSYTSVNNNYYTSNTISGTKSGNLFIRLSATSHPSGQQQVPTYYYSASWSTDGINWTALSDKYYTKVEATSCLFIYPRTSSEIYRASLNNNDISIQETIPLTFITDNSLTFSSGIFDEIHQKLVMFGTANSTPARVICPPVYSSSNPPTLLTNNNWFPPTASLYINGRIVITNCTTTTANVKSKGISYSNDGGLTWNPTNLGEGYGFTDLLYDGTVNRWYAYKNQASSSLDTNATDYHVYTSLDGMSWTQMNLIATKIVCKNPII